MIDRRGLEHRLALARLGIAPSAAAKARVLEGLSIARAPGLAPAVASSPVRAGAFTAPRVALLMGFSLAVGYGLGLWDAGVRAEPRGPSPVAALAPGAPPATRSSPPAPPPTLPPEQPSPPAPSAPPGPRAAAPAAKTDRSVSSENPVRRPAPASSSAAPQRDLSRDAETRARHDELALLRRIERALRAKEAALAHALLDELEQRHPRSTLREERTAARVMAECLLARDGAPAGTERVSAERFLADNGTSVYADRVRRACRLRASFDPEGSR